MTGDAVTLATVAGAVAIGAVSPGPSFVYVSRLALARSRRHGLAGAVGMGVGSVVFAMIAMVGLGALLQVAEWAFIVLKVLGGAYLLILGIRMFLHAGRDSSGDGPVVPDGPLWRSTAGASTAQLSNPKAIVVYGSIFAAVLPADPGTWLFVAIPVAVLIIEAGWYAIVAIAMSASAPRRIYRRFARTVDRIAGATLGAIGAWFAADGIRTALR